MSSPSASSTAASSPFAPDETAMATQTWIADNASEGSATDAAAYVRPSRSRTAAPSTAPGPSFRPPTLAAQRPRVMPTALIVEDEPEANKLLAMVVRLRGYRTESAFTGGEALAKAGAARPDVVLLDLMLPDIDGFAICDRLKRNRDTNLIPIIMVTALHDADNRTAGVRVGANGYLTKPFTADDLGRVISRWVRGERKDGN